ncbi:HK97-gp10 family putative phage morphogenesis protein [Brevibacterium linens]|uniref:Phage protein, HK97 gp10 family n=1 Tax=Brevibacterium linens TaxID=1703 RepID=A0A0B9AT55_BRELN|nr:HK97-gp10 family putative phage morphogenesis protein [Brevibacterium linens]KHS52548.1 phage protein, HK97 gp10 family [Brevibacterium linens]
MDELANLAADLRAAGEKAQNMAADAIAKTAADISNDAKVFAPVRTGNLRNSIGYDLMQDSGGVGAEIGPTVSYAPHLEWGTSVMAPRPFLGPAFDRRSPYLEQALRSIGGEVI